MSRGVRKRVSPEDMETIYRLYDKYGNYAEVARRTGWSASTIGRYIRMKGSPPALRHAAGKNIGRK